MPHAERTVGDVQRGLGGTVAGDTAFDQDDHSVDDAPGLPSIDSTPRRTATSGDDRYAHTLVKPPRRERRALRKQRRRERATVVGRHPKLTVLVVLLVVLTPLWISLGAARPPTRPSGRQWAAG